MHRLVPALAAVLAAGCGYSGDPLPPLANIPSRVMDLAAVQRGDRIVAHFTLPRTTTEGIAIKEELKLDLRIGPVPNPYQEDVWVAGAMPVPAGVVENGSATYQIPSAAWTGKDAAIGVRTSGRNGKESGWSTLAIVPVVAPLEAPAAVRAENTAQGVKLSWQAAGTDFRIFRRSGAEGFTAVADMPQSPWTDTSTEYGKTYIYQIQTIQKLADNHEAESDQSQQVSITPQDVFPPAVPAGLRATPSSNSIELSWESDTEADLAGYRIYRSIDGGAFEKIADLSTLPTYSDHAVEHGKTYRYTITAFDQAGNESARSAPAEAQLE